MNEQEIIAGCKAGNRKSFEALYSRYGSILYGVAYRYAYGRFHAEDVLQEALIKVYQSIKYFKGEGSFEGWLKRIVVNTAINEFNKHKRSDWLYGEEKEALWSYEDKDTLDQLHAEQISKLIQSLPEGYRMVFNLFEIEGYSHAEIAEMMHISEGTSKSQLFKAKTKLKEELRKIGVHYYERI